MKEVLLNNDFNQLPFYQTSKMNNILIIKALSLLSLTLVLETTIVNSSGVENLFIIQSD